MNFPTDVPDKVVLFVDDLAANNTLGITTDPEKFDYNIQQLDLQLNMDFGMRMQLIKDKMVSIQPLGRYILIFEVDKEKGSKNIIFFDHQPGVPLENISKSISNQFSEELAVEFLRLQAHMAKDYTPQHDIIHLHCQSKNVN